MTSGRAGTHTVTLVPGDGVGPEVTAAARRVLDATGVRIAWEVAEAGAVALERHGTPLPDSLVESVRSTGVALKGPVATPVGDGFRSPNLALREALDLFLGVRPCRTFPGVETRYQDVDVIVMRMTGEDLYAGLELEAGTPATARVLHLAGGTGLPDDTGVSLKPLSRTSALRAASAAFAHAREAGRARITVVHKATVMRATDAVFLDAAREAANSCHDVECEDRLVDAMCHDLVVRPESFDVLFAPVMYGDLLSDLCAGLVGGLGLVPGASYGDTCAVFEPVHGTASRLEGTGLANPMATILSGALLLRHLGESEAAARVETAVAAVLADGATVTYDVRPARRVEGASTTREVADAVVFALG